MSPTVAIFGSSRATEEQPLYRDAERFGRRLAEAGYTIANGGYGGLMEATSRGAAVVDGRVIGVTAPSVFPERSGPNAAVTDEVSFDSIGARIAHLVDIADAAVALPGSLGTTAELIVAWNTNFVLPEPRPLIAVGPRWRRLVEYLADEIGADADLVRCVDSMTEAGDLLLDRFAGRLGT